jgi:hypothetical protein
MAHGRNIMKASRRPAVVPASVERSHRATAGIAPALASASTQSAANPIRLRSNVLQRPRLSMKLLPVATLSPNAAGAESRVDRGVRRSLCQRREVNQEDSAATIVNSFADNHQWLLLAATYQSPTLQRSGARNRRPRATRQPSQGCRGGSASQGSLVAQRRSQGGTALAQIDDHHPG